MRTWPGPGSSIVRDGAISALMSISSPWAQTWSTGWSSSSRKSTTTGPAPLPVTSNAKSARPASRTKTPFGPIWGTGASGALRRPWSSVTGAIPSEPSSPTSSWRGSDITPTRPRASNGSSSSRSRSQPKETRRPSGASKDWGAYQRRPRSRRPLAVGTNRSRSKCPSTAMTRPGAPSNSEVTRNHRSPSRNRSGHSHIAPGRSDDFASRNTPRYSQETRSVERYSKVQPPSAPDPEPIS